VFNFGQWSWLNWCVSCTPVTYLYSSAAQSFTAQVWLSTLHPPPVQVSIQQLLIVQLSLLVFLLGSESLFDSFSWWQDNHGSVPAAADSCLSHVPQHYAHHNKLLCCDQSHTCSLLVRVPAGNLVDSCQGSGTTHTIHAVFKHGWHMQARCIVALIYAASVAARALLPELVMLLCALQLHHEVRQVRSDCRKHLRVLTHPTNWFGMECHCTAKASAYMWAVYKIICVAWGWHVTLGPAGVCVRTCLLTQR
jgi:hypothetical protein